MAYKAVNGEIVVEKRPHEECSVCKVVQSCEPFGKDDAPICLPCAKKDHAVMLKAQTILAAEWDLAYEEAERQRSQQTKPPNKNLN